MGIEFDDAINDLWTLVAKASDAEIYLRSACQKLLFAQTRQKSLCKNIQNFKANKTTRETIGTLNIEMDFDHCINSLRSSIEHLAQLINSITCLGLSPNRKLGKDEVTIYKVKEKLLGSVSLELQELGKLLEKVIAEDWYKELHDLRITLYHEKYERLPRAYTVEMQRAFPNTEFLLPSNTAPSITESASRYIDRYCEIQIENIENLLLACYKHLINYVKAI